MPEPSNDVSAWVAEQLAHAPELTATAAAKLSRLLFGDAS